MKDTCLFVRVQGREKGDEGESRSAFDQIAQFLRSYVQIYKEENKLQSNFSID